MLIIIIGVSSDIYNVVDIIVNVNEIFDVVFNVATAVIFCRCPCNIAS